MRAEQGVLKDDQHSDQEGNKQGGLRPHSEGSEDHRSERRD